MNNTATQIDKNRNSEKLFDLLKTGSEEFLPEILQIIEEGFESDFKKNDWNLLHLAVQDGGNPDVVDKLISAGIDPTEKINGRNLLHLAVQKGGNPDVVDKLISAGIDPTEKDPEGWNLLHLAVQDGGNPDVVDKLISAGVDPTEKTDEGLDALEMAIGNPLVRLMTNTSPNKEVIKILSKEKEGKK